MIPYPKDPHFTSREDILDSIRIKFETERRVALTGIGGVGYVDSTLSLKRSLTKLHSAENHK